MINLEETKKQNFELERCRAGMKGDLETAMDQMIDEQNAREEAEEEVEVMKTLVEHLEGEIKKKDKIEEKNER